MYYFGNKFRNQTRREASSLEISTKQASLVDLEISIPIFFSSLELPVHLEANPVHGIDLVELFF
jgi:hypothetical protein